MKLATGDLSFLLLYVPEGELDSSYQGYSTWEQTYSQTSGSSTSSKFGTTIFPADKLIDNRYHWRKRKRSHISVLGQGQFNPSGMSFTKMLLEMIACSRGTWANDGPVDEGHKMVIQQLPYRTMSISIDNLSLGKWEDLMITVRRLLESKQIT
jgi:hypothetical protein